MERRITRTWRLMEIPLQISVLFVCIKGVLSDPDFDKKDFACIPVRIPCDACIHRCDGIKDCTDGSDEKFCQTTSGGFEEAVFLSLVGVGLALIGVFICCLLGGLKRRSRRLARAQRTSGNIAVTVMESGAGADNGATGIGLSNDGFVSCPEYVADPPPYSEIAEQDSPPDYDYIAALEKKKEAEASSSDSVKCSIK